MAARFLLLFLATVVAGDLQARREVERFRIERRAAEKEQWTKTERVFINVQYRVPVIDALGYFGAYDATGNFSGFREQCQPIAAAVQRLSRESWQGRDWPVRIEREIAENREQLYALIRQHFGGEGLRNFEAFQRLKYHYLTEGIFGSPIED